jgi:hypothetical protein
MADGIVAGAEKTVSTPMSWAKENPYAFAFLVLVVMLVVLHFSAGLHTWIQGRAAGGSKFWGSVGRLTGSIAPTVATTAATVGTTAAVVLGILWLAHGGQIHSLHDAVTMLLSGGLTLAAVAFPTTDFCALKDETGLYNSPINVGASSVERQFYLRAETEQFKGFPIKATDLQFAVTATVTQAAGPPSGPGAGSPLYWDELFALTDSFEIQSPRFGLICERTSVSGPVWKHFVEYIGNGYAYSGDDPFATISQDASSCACECPSDAVYTFTLYHTYPIMQRYLAKPDESAMFIGFLQNTLLKYRLAAQNALVGDSGLTWGSALASITRGVLVRAGYRYITGAVGGHPRGAMAVPPLAYCRVIKVPANGQIDILFPQVHNQGPQNCDVSQGERLVAAVMLSNNIGLPGPCNWGYAPGFPVTPAEAGLTEIGCEALGVRFTNNPDLFLAGKLETLRRSQPVAVSQVPGGGLNGIGPYCASWPYMLQGPAGASLMPTLCNQNLLGFPFVLPQLGTKISKMLRIANNINVHMRMDTPPAPTINNPSPQHCLYLHTLRDIDGAYAASMLAAAGIPGTVTRAVNHDADKAIATGKATKGSYVGIPHAIKEHLGTAGK